MNGNHAATALAALAGFVVGGVVASRFTEIAQALVAFGSLGALLGGFRGALLGREITSDAAVGAGFGVALGVFVVILDAIVGA